MKLCNDTVTLFNARYDKEDDCTKYVPTVITGVSWYSSEKSSVDSKGLKSANAVTIRIPADAVAGGKAYVGPKSYTSADSGACWTLNEGDLIAHGSVSLTDPTPAAIQRSCEEVMTIMSVTDNRRAPNAPHWRVIGS